MAYKQETYRGYGVMLVNGRDVGNVEGISLGITTSNFSLKNYRKVNGGKVIDQNSIENVEFSATLLDSSAENLALGVYGTQLTQLSEAFTDVEIAAVANELLQLDRIATFTTITVEDGTYRPAVEGVDYEVFVDGLMPLMTANFKLSGTYNSSFDVEALTANFPEVKIVCTMESEFEPGKRVRIVLHKVSLSPLASLSVLGDEATKLELKGSVLADASRPAGKSQYFSISKATSV